MTRRSITRGIIAVAGFFGVAALGFTVSKSTGSAANQAMSLARGNKPGEWRYWGADAWSTRYSSLDQVNASNFDSLQVAWRFDASKYGAETNEYYRTTPLFANGRLYTVATNRRIAFGLDPATGQVLWQRGIDEGIRFQKAPRRYAGRGLSYWTDGRNERILVVTPGYHLLSIDAKTGELDPKFGKAGVVDLMEGLGYKLVPLAVDDTGPLTISEEDPARAAKPGEKWNAETHTGADGTMGIDPSEGQIANSSPGIVVGDVFVVGNSSMHGYYPIHLHNIPGFIRGFDIHTGKQLWKFNLLPQPGEFGADTWKNGSKLGDVGTGKVDAWATYSADPELGLVYIPVGEGVNDDYGGHRPGANLFATSIVAIDVHTGQRKWHFQMVHHDMWDYDIPMAPNLLDVNINGQMRKIVASTTKIGWVYTFDRVTGQPIWPMPETPVEQTEVPGETSWPTQPIPTRPAPFAQQGLLPTDLIDYTPAIKDSALKIASRCRMGPYFIPPSPENGKGKDGPSKYTCSWYAPGASGGVNIDGGTAADPETGMIYVGGQTGVSALGIMHDPCSEQDYSETHDSCGHGGVLPPPPGYVAGAIRGRGFGGGRGGGGCTGPGNAGTIGGISIVKPKEMGGITAYDMHNGDKKWWVANGNQMCQQHSDDPLFAGVQLPKVATNSGSQAEVITTKTLLINGTGRQGQPGAGGRGRGGRAAGPEIRSPQLFAFDKATGKQVGAVNIPDVSTAVPMTYLYNGKQYIVFAYGSGSNIGLTALTLPNATTGKTKH